MIPDQSALHSYWALNLANVPNYLAYYGTIMVLVAVLAFAYKLVTPYDEWKLIRDNNKSAALSLGGVIIGFVVALKSIAAGSGSLLDLLLWGVIALVTQIIVFFVVDRMLGGVKDGIEQDKLSYGIILGSIHIAAGVANAGALTY